MAPFPCFGRPRPQHLEPKSMEELWLGVQNAGGSKELVFGGSV